jgi:hypothetical protein
LNENCDKIKTNSYINLVDAREENNSNKITKFETESSSNSFSSSNLISSSDSFNSSILDTSPNNLNTDYKIGCLNRPRLENIYSESEFISNNEQNNQRVQEMNKYETNSDLEEQSLLATSNNNKHKYENVKENLKRHKIYQMEKKSNLQQRAIDSKSTSVLSTPSFQPDINNASIFDVSVLSKTSNIVAAIDPTYSYIETNKGIL